MVWILSASGCTGILSVDMDGFVLGCERTMRESELIGDISEQASSSAGMFESAGWPCNVSGSDTGDERTEFESQNCEGFSSFRSSSVQMLKSPCSLMRP